MHQVGSFYEGGQVSGFEGVPHLLGMREVGLRPARPVEAQQESGVRVGASLGVDAVLLDDVPVDGDADAGRVGNLCHAI